jgi:hypothetical protein
LRTDDIDQTHAELRSQGLQVSPLLTASATTRKETSLAGVFLPLMGILTACRIPLFCNGEKMITHG